MLTIARTSRPASRGTDRVRRDDRGGTVHGARAGTPRFLRTATTPAPMDEPPEHTASMAGTVVLRRGNGDDPLPELRKETPAPEEAGGGKPGGGPAQAAPCDPTPLPRADYLKRFRGSSKHFGLTTCSLSTADRPRVETVPAPGGRKGYVLPRTPDVMPPIRSVYKDAGTFEEGQAYFDGRGSCPTGQMYPIRYTITADGASAIRDAEIEHCADFHYAWKISMARYAAAVNDVSARGTVFANHSAAKEAVRRIVGPHPDDWMNVWLCLAGKTELRDVGSGRSPGWHEPQVGPNGQPHPPSSRDSCAFMRAIIAKSSLPEVNKHPSTSIIKDCNEGPPAKKGGAKTTPKPKAAPTTPPVKSEGKVPAPAAGDRPAVWRKGACACGGSCAHCRASAATTSGLRVSQPSDPEEREADAVAERVLHRMPETPAGTADPPATPPRDSAARGGSTTPYPEVIPAGGAPLGRRERAFFEPRFGHGLGGVRIHTGDVAANLARRFDARAYTVDQDIVFGSGQFRTADAGGLRLLAHELAHTLQDGDGLRHRRIRRTTFEACTAGQTPTVRDAVNEAVDEINAAQSELRRDPMPRRVELALWLSFRSTARTTADTVIEKLEEIKNGLPNVNIDCEQPDDFGYDFFCGSNDAYVRAAAALFGTGSIHLCMADWDSHSIVFRRRLIVHEGSHRFNSTDDEGYFANNDCSDTAGTAGLGKSDRLDNADSYACVVFHLLHSPEGDMESQLEDYAGRSLGGIEQTPAGPIDLNATNTKKPLFSIRKKTGPLAFIPGFEYRWIIRDADDRRYKMIGMDGESVFRFGDHVLARIGRPTRALLKERGITEATVLCRAKVPRRGTQLFELAVTFTF